MTNRCDKGTMYCFLLLCLFVFCISPAASLRAADDDKKAGRVPTVITSKTLNADNKARTALFEGDVVAVKGEMTMYADKMLVHYADEKSGNNIKQIDSEGNVKLVKQGRVVTSKYAVYYAEPEERVIFTGEPRAIEGENVVTGTKMTYFLKDDRSIVEKSKVFLLNNEKQAEKQ